MDALLYMTCYDQKLNVLIHTDALVVNECLASKALLSKQVCVSQCWNGEISNICQYIKI